MTEVAPPPVGGQYATETDRGLDWDAAGANRPAWWMRRRDAIRSDLRAGISAAELAVIHGVSRQRIHQIAGKLAVMTARTRFDAIRAALDAYGVSMDSDTSYETAATLLYARLTTTMQGTDWRDGE